MAKEKCRQYIRPQMRSDSGPKVEILALNQFNYDYLRFEIHNATPKASGIEIKCNKTLGKFIHWEGPGFCRKYHPHMLGLCSYATSLEFCRNLRKSRDL